MKLDKNAIYSTWKNNIQHAIDAYEDMVELNEEKKDRIFKLEQSVAVKTDLIETLEEEIVMFKEAKESLLSQAKHLSGLNGQLIRERNDMEDKLIEATKPWYSKLFVWKKKLFKLSIRNPFYLES
tara:strand:+ start:4625 stop:4999 length:375 start_codon:yes stop_codon:yes gene_type:complete